MAATLDNKYAAPFHLRWKITYKFRENDPVELVREKLNVDNAGTIPLSALNTMCCSRYT